MKKFDVKSLIAGFIIGTVGITTVFAAGGIKSAQYAPSKVYFYGEEVPLKDSLVSIVADGDANAKLYMPVRELLEFMQFNVEWSSADDSVRLTMNGNTGWSNNWQNSNIPDDIAQNEADRTALDIM